MKKIKILTIIFLSILLSTFTFGQNDTLTIQGKLDGFNNNEEITLWITNGNINQKIDKYKIENGQLQIKHHLKDTPNKIKLTASETRKRIVLWVNNDSIKITGNKDQFDKSKIIGSKYLKSESFFYSLYSRDSTIQTQVNIIENNLNTPSAVHHLSRLYQKIPFEDLTRLYTKLNHKWKAHDYGKKINNYISLPERKNLLIGDRIIDFSAKDKNGSNFLFSDNLYQNKYILLEFSSYACPWCRKAIPIISQINQEYKDQIQVVTFIQDTRSEIWEKYLEKFESDWTQIWDGEGEIGKTFLSYGITGTPNYFLINPNGTIEDKWTGFEEKEILEQRLINALGK